MTYEKELKFFRSILNNYRIDSCIIPENDKSYRKADRGLRDFLGMEEEYDQLFCTSHGSITENMICKILSYKGKVFGVEPPTFVELAVTETDPGFKGDTSTGATKPATLETGAQIMVPLFIDNNEMIRVDTRTGEYMERV